MKYYTLNEQGRIAQSADWKFDPACLETEKAILRGADGKLYLEDNPAYTPIPEPNPHAEEISQLKAYLQSTDYVTNKIVESGLTLSDFLEANAKYADVLAQREAARAKIGEMEG